MQFCYTGEKELPRILMLGLGKKSECSVRKLKHAVGAATIACQNKKVTKIAYLHGDESLRHLTVAMELAAYSYDEHKREDQLAIRSMERHNGLAIFRHVLWRQVIPGWRGIIPATIGRIESRFIHELFTV